MTRAHTSSPLKKPNGVKHIIAIGSGKGGVGKSTTAVNIAAALELQNKQVGLLDADIFGPNQPTLLGIQTRPELKNNQFQPIHAHGLYTMSMGLLVNEDTPMIWRGPMVTKAFLQILFHTAWPQLDYLIIDLPPGTGDVQLTLLNKVRLHGAIIITTPQTLATDDARKGLEMFLKLQAPVLGIVENMSYHQCTQCGHTDALFGEGGGAKLAALGSVPLIGTLPLIRQIQECSDQGRPIVLQHPDHAATKEYHRIANHIIEYSHSQAKSAFPDIVVEPKKGD